MNADAHQVIVIELDESVPLALYRHYDGQTAMQPCHVALDLRDGELCAGYNPEIAGAVPACVYHGFVLWWEVPCLTAAAANRLLRALTPLAQRMLDGSTVRWRGSKNGGVLTPAAQVAEQDISELIAEQTPKLECVVEVDPDRWFDVLPAGLSADTTNDDLAELVAEHEREAATTQPGRYTVLRNAHSHLTGLREDLRQSHRDDLATLTKQIACREQDRNELIVRLASHGDTTRDLAPLAGLTYLRVKNVLCQRTGASTVTGVKTRSEQRQQDDRNELASTADEIAALEQDRNTLIARLGHFGDTTRDIAALAGLSHAWVGKLLKRMAQAKPSSTHDNGARSNSEPGAAIS